VGKGFRRGGWSAIGWANYFQHAVAKNVFAMLDTFAWWRVARMLRVRHHWGWKDVRARFTAGLANSHARRVTRDPPDMSDRYTAPAADPLIRGGPSGQAPAARH
jgi:hypothetical protein